MHTNMSMKMALLLCLLITVEIGGYFINHTRSSTTNTMMFALQKSHLLLPLLLFTDIEEKNCIYETVQS